MDKKFEQVYYSDDEYWRGKSAINKLSNQSSDILQHSQNRPTGDRWLKF